ncbi:MAG: UDP binding domain-containing protein, partial [Patescibacteria group bacterium]
KVIENVQRDLNIALMNELSLIFDKIGIDTKEVIEAAGTKWNFHKYQPGLVGGHCIGVDPYYLTYKAQKLGYQPKVILAGRDTNEYMAEFVAKKLTDKKKILIMGLTFKENVPDTRNSKAKELIIKLKEQGSEIFGHDPLIKFKEFIVDHFKVGVIDDWPPKDKFDAVVIFSPHQVFKTENYSLSSLKSICNEDPVLFDIKGFYNKAEAEKLGFKYMTL